MQKKTGKYTPGTYLFLGLKIIVIILKQFANRKAFVIWMSLLIYIPELFYVNDFYQVPSVYGHFRDFRRLLHNIWFKDFVPYNGTLLFENHGWN